MKLWREFDSVNPKGPSVTPVVELNRDQKAALGAIRSSIRGGEYRTFLIHGVTGSGKTEVYLRAIEEALSQGKGSLLLVPEIALTPAVAAQFFGRFGDKVAILHSAFSGWERSGQWRRLRQGKARVAVGTRSAVFAPVENLGLIIVDEEHDGSYKQDEDASLQRARCSGCPRPESRSHGGAGFGHAQPRVPPQRRAREVRIAHHARENRKASAAESRRDRHAAGVRRDAPPGPCFPERSTRRFATAWSRASR